MLKCRQALETMTHALGGKGSNLFANISELSDCGILDKDTARMFHFIRRASNHSIPKDGKDNQVQIGECLDCLLELTIWFAVKKGKSYPLSFFMTEDIKIAQKYISPSNKSLNQAMSMNPLSIQDDFEEQAPVTHSIIEKDVFETEEEYEQRISRMNPVHIGYGILDTRSRDGYTDIIFLSHYLDKNSEIQMDRVDAFYAEDMNNEKDIIDDELVVELKVHKGKSLVRL